MNIFEAATKQKLRFPSQRGELTTEQLWDLPLQARNNVDLDTVAKTINRDLKQTAEESFVTNANPASTTLELKLTVVKHIIEVKKTAADAATRRAQKRAERDRLMEILHQKKDQEMMGMSAEEIEKRINELSD